MPRLGTDDDAHRNNTTNRRPTHIPVGSNNMATAYAANNHEPFSRLTGILFILAITFILKNVLFHYALDETNNVQKMKHDIAYLLQAVQEVKDQLTVWKSSGTKFVSDSGSRLNDVLNCAPLKSGTFEWKIKVHSASSDCLFLGVIGSSLKLPLDNSIVSTNKTWGYKSRWGSTYYWNDGQKVIEDLPEYTDGSIVHFVLDLTNEGTLCVSVDGSPSVQLFSNMKSLIDQDEGFLPATSMVYHNKIELLEFKSLPIDISSVMIQKTLYS